MENDGTCSCFRILLVCIAVLSAYSIHLLLKSAGVVGKTPPPPIFTCSWITCCNWITCASSNVFGISGIRAYEQLGNRAFGPPGKMLAACIITVHNIGGKASASAVREAPEDTERRREPPSLLLFPYPFFCSPAMSSYLFIVKSELPLVIQAFLSKHENTG